MVGTIVNTVAVVAGGLIGMGLHRSLPQRFIDITFQVLGVFTLFIGIQMAMESNQPLVLIMSLLLGSLLGEALHLEKRIENGVAKLKKMVGGNDHFSEGLITAFLLFCIGAMTILGCIEEGLRNNRTLLYTKSIMDFFSSIALASAFGRGVVFTAIPLFLFQTGLTLGAAQLSPVLTAEVQAEVIGSGGILLIALGIQILEIRRFRIFNMLPALLIAFLFAYLLPLFH